MLVRRVGTIALLRRAGRNIDRDRKTSYVPVVLSSAFRPLLPLACFTQSGGMRRLPVVQPQEDSNGSFSNRRQPCAVLMFISDPLGIGK